MRSRTVSPTRDSLVSTNVDAPDSAASRTWNKFIESRDTWAVIDHKSFGLATAATNVGALAGQLGCYADALTKARPNATVSMWVHLPFDGAVVQVE